MFITQKRVAKIIYISKSKEDVEMTSQDEEEEEEDEDQTQETIEQIQKDNPYYSDLAKERFIKYVQQHLSIM